MSIVRIINAPFRRLFLGIIRLYQMTLSPLIGRQCRFSPTCSHYGYEAISLHGPWRGGWLTFKRICRCNPLSRPGYDPVPPPEQAGSGTPPHFPQDNAPDPR